jgi:DNA-binding MarR family transcriptional regulator
MRANAAALKLVTDTPEPELGEVLDFMRSIWAMDHSLKLISKHMEAHIGLTGPQRLVVRMLGRFGKLSAGKLADVLHMHPSTLTGILHRLERRRVIRRQADPEDGRRAILSLTERGKQLDETREGTAESAIRRVLSRLTPQQISSVRQTFLALAEEVAPKE